MGTIAPVFHFGDILNLRFQQNVLFNCHLLSHILFYLKSNLLHIAKNNLHNPQGVTAGLFAILLDGYRATCPMTCAINFSGKAKLCFVCTCPISATALIQIEPLHRPAVQEQFFSESHSRLFSPLCLNHLLQSFIIQLFLTSCPLLLFTYCSLFVSLTQHFVLLIHIVAPLSWCQHHAQNHQPLRFLSCVYKQIPVATHTQTHIHTKTHKCPSLG